MPRRRAGQLLSLEVRILEAGLALQRDDSSGFHGFALAKTMSGRDGRALTAHGTLYKALGRLTERGLLVDEWEDPDLGVAEGRPRRRLYRVTGSGEVALQQAHTRVKASTRLGPSAPTGSRPATA